MHADALVFEDLFHVECVSGRISPGSSRYAMFDAATLGSMRRELMDNLGRNVTRRILGRVGHRCGQHDAQQMRNRFSWDSDEALLQTGFQLCGLEGMAGTDIRELRNAIERAMIPAEANRVAAKYLPIRISEGGVMPVPTGDGSSRGEIQLQAGGTSLFNFEKKLIRQALEQARGNKTTAARLLRITRDTLRYKVKKYNLE